MEVCIKMKGYSNSANVPEMSHEYMYMYMCVGVMVSPLQEEHVWRVVSHL